MLLPETYHLRRNISSFNGIQLANFSPARKRVFLLEDGSESRYIHKPGEIVCPERDCRFGLLGTTRRQRRKVSFVDGWGTHRSFSSRGPKMTALCSRLTWALSSIWSIVRICDPRCNFFSFSFFFRYSIVGRVKDTYIHSFKTPEGRQVFISLLNRGCHILWGPGNHFQTPSSCCYT